jgi:hypothetical protein
VAGVEHRTLAVAGVENRALAVAGVEHRVLVVPGLPSPVETPWRLVLPVLLGAFVEGAVLLVQPKHHIQHIFLVLVHPQVETILSGNIQRYLKLVQLKAYVYVR